MEFNDLGLSRALLDAVRRYGYSTPTPIQSATIPLALSGEDILGCAQTGTGKTAAFALPILQSLARSAGSRPAGRPVRALVLAPTRELAMQNYEAFRDFGQSVSLTSAVVFGGVNQNRQVEQLRSGADVLAATPGRLLDLIGQGLVSLRDIEIFVLDEADRMLDMGFIHDVKRVIALLPVRRQTMLFSATMPPEVEELALGMLRDPKTVKVDPVTSTVDKIRQLVYYVAREDKKNTLLYLLKEKGVYAALVFTRTKGGADQVVRLLTRNGIKAMAIHGDKSQNARERALNSFKAGQISVLAATDIASRGIDISELPYVINYNVPEESETYIHRIGRTGRAGLDGTAVSLCAPDELLDFRTVEKLIGMKVPVESCPWSVENIKPEPKPPKQPRPLRKDRPVATADGRKRHAEASVRPGANESLGRTDSGYNATGRIPAHRSRTHRGGKTGIRTNQKP